MNRLFAVIALVAPTAFALAAESAPRAYLTQPAPSPDGREIAFVSGGDLWVVPAQGGDAHLLVPGPAAESRPLYSPDGKRLAFISMRSGNGDLYTLEFASGRVERITYDDAFDNLSAWSRDGEWLFAGTERGSLAVFDGITRTMVAEQSLGPSGILAICWMEQESAVAAGTVEGRVCLLDVPSLAIRAQCRPHHAVIRALAVDDEGTLWSGATDGRVMRTRLVNDRFTNSQEL